MITFNNIGYYGRLGNQMFQYATLLGISKKINCEVGIPTVNSKIIKQIALHPSYFKLDEYFNLSVKRYDSIQPKFVYEYNDGNFNENIFKLQDSTDILGYFQSEKYFLHAKEFIVNEFKFKNKQKYKKHKNFISRFDCPVSFHVRRGDYAYLTNVYNIDLMDYYAKSIKIIQELVNTKLDILVFSDDIEWCKSNLTLLNPSMHYISNSVFASDQEDDMMLMSLCNHNIIANSSFSWWASWLNPNKNKIVTAPKKWLVDRPYEQYKDIYCEGWIVV